MTGVSVAFESKAPHTTPWLSIEINVGEEPTELIAALAELGWKEDERYPRIPPLDGREEIVVSPPMGSALFGGWSAAEAKKYMPPVRRLLRTYGCDRVPWNRLTVEDLL